MKPAIPLIVILLLAFSMSAMSFFEPVVASLLLIPTASVLLGAGIAVVMLTKRNRVRLGASYLAGLALIGVIAFTHFPLRMTFLASESALRRLATKVSEGGSLAEPTRAGFFTIAKATQRPNGSVFLMTDANPSGPTGFVYRYPGEGYNIWSEFRLADEWHFIAED